LEKLAERISGIFIQFVEMPEGELAAVIFAENLNGLFFEGFFSPQPVVKSLSGAMTPSLIGENGAEV
jgi:hypothetical protein